MNISIPFIHLFSSFLFKRQYNEVFQEKLFLSLQYLRKPSQIIANSI